MIHNKLELSLNRLSIINRLSIYNCFLSHSSLGSPGFLTDLPDVVPQLQRNLDADPDVDAAAVRTVAYPWGTAPPEALPRPCGVVLAADCLYDTDGRGGGLVGGAWLVAPTLNTSSRFGSFLVQSGSSSWWGIAM